MKDFMIDLARKSSRYSELIQKHGSILMCDDQIFTGYNHFTCGKNCVPIHAEEDAINNFLIFCRKKYYDDAFIRRKLRRSLLITIRFKNHHIRGSAPCRDCIELIKSYGIREIIYSELDSNDNMVFITKKIRDVENRQSSGYRWRERLLLTR